MLNDLYFQMVAEKQKFKKNPHNYAVRKTNMMKQRVRTVYLEMSVDNDVTVLTSTVRNERFGHGLGKPSSSSRGKTLPSHEATGEASPV